MTEPDVTLTDYALTLECAVFALLLQLGPAASQAMRFWLTLFFLSVGLASLLGGTVHGFYLKPTTPGHHELWQATLLAVGVTAICGWVIGATLVAGPATVKVVAVAALVQYAIYAYVVLFIRHEFWVAAIDYLPGAIFLMVAFYLASRREGAGILAVAAAGMALTLVATLLQQLKVGIHPVYFNYNAVFHVVQAVALLLFFLGSRPLVTTNLLANRHADPSSHART